MKDTELFSKHAVYNTSELKENLTTLYLLKFINMFTLRAASKKSTHIHTHTEILVIKLVKNSKTRNKIVEHHTFLDIFFVSLLWESTTEWGDPRGLYTEFELWIRRATSSSAVFEDSDFDYAKQVIRSIDDLNRVRN